MRFFRALWSVFKTFFQLVGIVLVVAFLLAFVGIYLLGVFLFIVVVGIFASLCRGA